MSMGSAPKTASDRGACIIGKAEAQPCNVTDDNLGPDVCILYCMYVMLLTYIQCYESMHAFKKIRTSTSGLRKSPNKWTKVCFFTTPLFHIHDYHQHHATSPHYNVGGEPKTRFSCC